LGIEESDRYGVESTVLPEIKPEDSIEENSVLSDAGGAVKV
jgi:hypothetical protein